MLWRPGPPADRPGEVEFRPDGWFISSAGELVPFGDDKIKASQDHWMHVCTYSTDDWLCASEMPQRARP
jgi:hypothetical protein